MPRKRAVRDLSTFGRAVRSQGRTYPWMAEQSGFSLKHVQKVATGKEVGSLAFHKAMWRILDVEYKLPRGVMS